MQDICLIGFGAIGALYAFALDKSSQVRVTVVCRSNFDAIQADGLEVISERLGDCTSWYPYRVLRTVQEATDRPYSFVICAFKSLLDVQPTASILAPMLDNIERSPDTAIVLLQNGIGIEDDIQNTLTSRGCNNVVISGCAWVDTTLIGGKTVVQRGKERLVLGYHRPKGHTGQFSEERAQSTLDVLCTLLRSGGAHVESASVDAARWRKVLWNASFSTLCTLSRTRVCDVLAVPQSRQALVDIMLEVLSVARACLPEDGAALLPDSVAQDVINNENPKSVFKPSMLVDLEAGRPIEVEAIVGGIVKRAKEVGVNIPRLEIIYASLLLVQRTLVSSSSL
ncbi:hypothetical protein NM688_g2886 [Phlebia brevispora]|uniref:Uncharacterized protein n=1 Tax=Phlebia brevispora TaxID=194682 RepID=A0ACC1T7B1_9APHY|nr:hypothetical protein NM688_g2886 [Phlebia brevispora]